MQEQVESHRKSPVLKVIRIAAYVMAALFALLVILAIVLPPADETNGPTTAADQTPSANVLEVTVDDLQRAYDANEAGTQLRYGDKTLRVTGTVASVNLGIADDVNIAFAGPGIGTQASMNEEARVKAAALAKGDKIVVTCTRVTELLGNPMLSDCTL